MDSNTKENINKSIALLRASFKKHANPESWATNIQKACKHLKTRTEWAHFYHYLSNPTSYNMETIKIEEETHPMEVDTDFEFKGLDSRLEPIIYRNGDEAVIHLRRRTETQDDEKKENG